MAGAIAQGELIGATSHVTRSVPSIEFGLASRRDDAALRRLLRDNPMLGSIGVCLECEPSFFDALAIQGTRSDVLVAREVATGSIVAMGSRSVREVFLNGQVSRLGYLSQLRIDSAWRRRKRLLIDGYSLTGSFRKSDELPFDFTTVMADNHVARRVLTSGVRGLPRYVELDELVTLAIPTGGRSISARCCGFAIGPASPHDLPEIVDCLNRNNCRFQLGPRWTERDLLSLDRCRGLTVRDFHLARQAGHVVGCAALWDQRPFKQAVVRRYPMWLSAARPLLNCVAPLLGQPRLPPIGHPLRCAFLSHLAVDDDDPGVALALIDSARLRARCAGT